MIALHLWLAWGNVVPGDRWALAQVLSHPALPERIYVQFFAYLGTPVVAIPLVLLAAALIRTRGSRGELVGLGAACCAVAINAVLKLILGPSPVWTAAHRAGHDYPSGHVTFVVAVIGYLGWVAWRHGQRWLAALALLLVVLVGPARVVTGIHLATDVIGGYLLGASVLMLAAVCADRLDAARESGPLKMPLESPHSV